MLRVRDKTNTRIPQCDKGRREGDETHRVRQTGAWGEVTKGLPGGLRKWPLWPHHNLEEYKIAWSLPSPKASFLKHCESLGYQLLNCSFWDQIRTANYWSPIFCTLACTDLQEISSITFWRNICSKTKFITYCNERIWTAVVYQEKKWAKCFRKETRENINIWIS